MVIDLVVYAFAAWRLASLLVNEDGPFRIFERLRSLVGIETITTASENGYHTAHVANGPIAEGLMCVWCTSVWCAALLVIGSLLPVAGIYVTWFTRILAISAGAIIIQVVIESIKGPT
jgi:hypothetical protein